MENKKKLVVAFGFIIVAALVWWFAPKKFLGGVHETEVSSVTVWNGNNDNVFEIKNKDDIRYIVRDIKNYKFKKLDFAFGKVGIWYTLTFYGLDNKLITELVINGDSIIRKEPFFYKTGDGHLQNILDYLEDIEKD